MAADMLTAALARPATLSDKPLDFDGARQYVKRRINSGLPVLDSDDYETDLEQILEDFDPEIHLEEDDAPRPDVAERAALKIIDELEETLTHPDREINTFVIGGYQLYVTGGMSWGDPPTDAATVFWNAMVLHDHVLGWIGFVPDPSGPVAKKNGSMKTCTDTDIVDAIALGLGTRPSWDAADTLNWIADTIGMVREHPGDRDPVEYIEAYRDRYGFDPLTSKFLRSYIDDEVLAGDDEDE